MVLDINKLVEEHAARKAATSKPRFIPKAERERLAAEKSKQEELDKKQKEEQARQKRRREERWLSKTPIRHFSSLTSDTHSASQYNPNGPHGAYRRDELASQQNKRAKAADVLHQNRKPSAQELEEAALRAKYMGPEVNKHSKFSASKKRKRTTEKKFNFGWDDTEDTSLPDDPLYGQRSSWTGSLAGLNGEYNEDAEANALEHARFIEKHDPETGRERAKAMMSAFYEGRKRYQEKWARTGAGTHWSKKKLADMQNRDWRILKEDYDITTKGGSIPNPMRSWEESGLDERLLNTVSRVGYTEPTPIQRAAIPIALGARDLIGVAVTGSGKTAAFLLPLLQYIMNIDVSAYNEENRGPTALILAPTRELVLQIMSEAAKFATPLGFKCVAIIGGHAIEEQAADLEGGVDIVIATPGRLVDCLERRLLVLSQCCYVIMDEADRMIDFGFEDSVSKILAALPEANEKPDTEEAENAQLMTRYIDGNHRYRQTMMFTATMPPQLQQIARSYLRRPATVQIGNVGEAVDTVEQIVDFVPSEDLRFIRLEQILASNKYAAPIIIFVNIKDNCENVARRVKKMGWAAATMHGGKSQPQREAALKSVRLGHAQILVATDVAGRGIDIPDVSLVVNFNMATNIESYTHRIGRTGRAGKTGVAITFLGDEDSDVLFDLKQMLSKSTMSKVPDKLKEHPAAQAQASSSRRRAEHDGNAKAARN
ncbi:DEAD-domain-containing protein [Paramyrothecium foliicola]|nr:DEAD-domain-containing protein [Paramyrothecium foliicola]